MHRLITAAVFVASCVPVVALAGPSVLTKVDGSRVDLSYARSNFDFDGLGKQMEGNGGGGKLWLGSGLTFLTGQYDGATMDKTDSGIKIKTHYDDVRAGLGLRPINTDMASVWVRAEYVRLRTGLLVAGTGVGSDTEEGLGAHVGGMLGYLFLRGYGEFGHIEADDARGNEYTFGISVQPGLTGAFVEYRITDLETNEGDVDERLRTLRVGVRVAFE